MRILQHCLANNARLKLSTSLNPMPSIAFETPNFLHSIRWILFELSSNPHQNFLNRPFNLVEIDLGRRKIPMVQVRMVYKNDLRSISFLTKERNLAFQFDILCQVLSRRFWKDLVFFYKSQKTQILFKSTSSFNPNYTTNNVIFDVRRGIKAKKDRRFILVKQRPICLLVYLQ